MWGNRSDDAFLLRPTDGEDMGMNRGERAAATASTDLGTNPRPQAGARLHGLDALRAGALLLGIVLHALMTFVPPVGGLGWMVQDTRPLAWAMPVIAVIHLFRMSLFMLLAGYFAHVVVMRRGMPRFLRERAVRIALPVVAFWPFAVLPLALVSVVWGTAHGVTAEPPPPDGPMWLQKFTPGHLWFLWSLFQCCLIFAAARWLLHRFAASVPLGRAADSAARLITSPVGACVLAVPYAAVALWQGATYAGIQEPTTILPEAPSLLAFMTAFTAGWLLARRSGSLQALAARWIPQLILAGLSSVLVLWLSGMLGVSAPLPDGDALHLALATAAALATWWWVLGLLGLGTRHLDRERPWVRYLADASYWMYLIHLPLLAAIQGTMTHLGWPAVLKLVLALALTTAVLLITYDGFVRSTWIGRWLNGRRRARVIVARAAR